MEFKGFGGNRTLMSLGNKEANDITITAPEELKPGIYQMVKDAKGISVVFESNIIQTPELIFGLTKERVLRFWKRFIKQDSTLGVLSVGSSGSGKTMEADLLSNLAVMKANLPVIKITGFNVDEKVVQYIQQLDNVCLYFDEFTKHVGWQAQRLLLPTLTNTNKKFLVLLTENSKSEINSFILNRTGRVRYIVEHDKLEKEVILDYLSLFDIVSSFKKDLLERYDKAMTFSFDNLMGIITEHQDYPEESLDEILKYLNITSIKKDKGYKLIKVTKLMKQPDDTYKEESVPVDIPYTLDKARLSLEVQYVYYSNTQPSVKISKDDLTENIDGKLIFVVNKTTLEFRFE